MNDFRYFQLYSILNSLFTLVTSHSATNYLINLDNNNIDIFTCQILYTYVLTYHVFNKKKYDIAKYQIKSNTPQFL